MIRILFVCHGNICRSPMAEYVLIALAQRRGLSDMLSADSCATSREEIGNPVYPPARRTLMRHGIPCGEHRARQMTKADYDTFDRILCMDRSNVRNVLKITGGDPDRKIGMLLDHAGRIGEEVSDPWYTGDFEAAWNDILSGVEGLLSQLFPQDKQA